MVHAHRPLKNTMRFARWIIKATNTHLEYVILTAFPQQTRLHESSSMLRYMLIGCLLYSGG